MAKLKDLLSGQFDKKTTSQAPSHQKTGRQQSYRPKNANWAEEAFDFLSLVKSWPEIVGERLSQHTVPLKNRGKTLTILTNHSAFSQQLKFMEEVLIQKITEHFPTLRGKVKKLQFIMDTTHFNKQKEVQESVSKEKASSNPHPKKKELHPYSPEYRRLKKEADKEFQEVQDEEVKKYLTSLYMQAKRED